MSRRLVLTKDVLGELSTEDLRSVVGGREPTIDGCLTPVVTTIPTVDSCLTGIYPTFDGCI